MSELEKEFENMGYVSWINSDIYPDGKIHTREYTQWLERQVLVLRQPPVDGRSEQLKVDEHKSAEWRSKNLGYGSKGEMIYVK